jgi:serine/threonine protein kinase
MADRVGTFLDRYEIDAKLGQGAMGVVYRARDPKLQRVVAIKTVSISALDPEAEQEFRKRFVIEAQAAGRLSHPGIVTIFDVREEPEPFLVMEYVEGQSLQQLIGRESRTLPLSTTLRLVQEVAEALHYAHVQGVVHRDIKPANILVTPDGHPKIADFGVAKLNQTDVTLPGQVFGSPAFMAPEQLTEEGSDARSDLFSLGVILYYMLTGHRPFQGNSTTTVCFKLVNHEPVPVSAFEAKFSPQLDKIVSQAMAKDPAQRYQSGMAMAADIQALRESSGFVHGGVARTKASPQPQSVLVAPASPKPASQKRRSEFSGPFLVASILATAVLAGFAIWGAHLTTRDTPIPFKTEAVAVPAFAVQGSGVQSPLAQTNGGAIKAHSRDRAANQTVSQKASNGPKPKKTTAAKATLPAEPEAAADAMLQIEVEHHFADASASVWLDNNLIYTKTLHGEKQRRALLFKQVNGQQFDVIKVPSGKHQVRVRVQSDTDSYDQSKMISDASIQGASILRITCGQKGTGLQLTLQKAENQ